MKMILQAGDSNQGRLEKILLSDQKAWPLNSGSNQLFFDARPFFKSDESRGAADGNAGPLHQWIIYSEASQVNERR